MNTKQSTPRQNITNSDLLFARQPIFDSDKRIYAFELLYRDKDPSAAFIEDGDKATSSLIVNYCSSIINEEDNPSSKVFINLTRNLLLSDYFFPLEPTKIVIEILEDVIVDNKLVDRIIDLRSKGYQFALDDYEFSKNFDPLLPLVDYIKIELLPFSQKELTDKMANFEKQLSQLRKRPILLAEKVENQESYDLCESLGFDLFQGYFLEKPVPVYGKKIEHNSETALRIVAELQDNELQINDVTRSISRDANLSYQILKIVNSPLCRIPRVVDNLHEAVVLLGLEQIKKWAVAMALSGNSNRSKELFRILLTRARACELVAELQSFDKPESYFTVGLFSGIDAVMLADKQWLIENLRLPKDVTQAVMEYKGKKGKVLKRIIALEHGEYGFAKTLNPKALLDYYQAHETSVKWVNQLFTVIQ